MINRRELFLEEEQGLRKMTKIEWMWEDLKATPNPHFHDSVEPERELAVLDFYMMWSIEEFIEGEGIFDPRMIVLLRECKRGLASLLRRLDGAAYASYFEQLLALTREVLKRVKVKEAYRIVRRDAEREKEYFDSSLFDRFFEDQTTVPIEQTALSTKPLQVSE